MSTTFSFAFFLAAVLVLTTATLAAPCAEVSFTNTVNVQAPGQYQTGVTFADFNNDGHLDTLFSSGENNKVSLRFGDGTGNFSGGTDVTPYDIPWGVTAADFNGDGNMDFASAHPQSSYILVFFGDGAGGFGPFTPYAVAGPYTNYLATADFNNDGKPDIISPGQAAHTVNVLMNDGTGAFNVTYVPMSSGSFGITVGDLNSDGNTDFATANLDPVGSVSVRLGNGSGGFTAMPDLAAGFDTWGISIGNFNGDAFPDLAASNRGSDNVMIFAGDGSGNFSLVSTTITPSHPEGLAVADFNLDGTDDVVTVPNDSNELRVFLGDGAGSLTPIAPLFVDYNSVAVATADINGDGGPDFATSNNGGFQKQVRIFLNSCSAPTDTTPPTIEIVQPTNSTYLLNQSVTVQFSCEDEESGLASCIGSSPNGSLLNTSVPGSHTFTVTASDNAGNNSQQVVHYTVGYGIVVLYDQTKAHKSGSTIPVKIRLVDAYGNNVSSASTVVHSISVVQTSTMASTVLDDAGSANPDFDFRYDTGLAGYIFNLKTTGYTTGSYVLNFVVGGGPTVYSVGFQVRQ